MDNSLLTLLLGSAVGLIMALTGAGGGVLAVPMLVFGLSMSMQQAVPVALLAVGASALLGAVLGLREGVVRYRAAAVMGGLAMLTAPLGVRLAQRLPAPLLLAGSAALLAWTAWRMLHLSRTPGGESGPAARACLVNPQAGRLRWTAPCARALMLTGAITGLLSGLLGVGGGFVIVPTLSRHSDLDMRSIAATSLAVIALGTLGGIVSASQHGHLDGTVAGLFGTAAVVALLAGRQLARRWPPARLQRGFAVLCAIVAVLMLMRALTGSAG